MMIELLCAKPQDRTLVRQLYELYCHDFSPMTRADIGDDGYWTDDDFLTPWPDDLRIFLIRVDRNWAGFAWIATGSYTDPEMTGHYLMAEFFIMRKYRRHGVGEWAAVSLFNQFSGVWEIGELPENIEAQRFWRTIIGRYTEGHFQESIVNNERWHGPVQVFTTL